MVMSDRGEKRVGLVQKSLCITLNFLKPIVVWWWDQWRQLRRRPVKVSNPSVLIRIAVVYRAAGIFRPAQRRRRRVGARGCVQPGHVFAKVSRHFLAHAIALGDVIYGIVESSAGIILSLGRDTRGSAHNGSSSSEIGAAGGGISVLAKAANGRTRASRRIFGDFGFDVGLNRSTVKSVYGRGDMVR